MLFALLALLIAQAPAPAAQAADAGPAASASADAGPAAAPPSAAPAEAASCQDEFDHLFLNRADPRVVKVLSSLVEPEVKKNPTDFEAAWRLASLLNWQANTLPDGDEKAALGKRAWEIGDKAIQ